MQISNEVLIGIIGIVATVLGAWAYTAKRRSDALLEKARADARASDAHSKEVEAEAETKVKEAEGKLAREKGDISQMQLVTEMMKQQVTINQQLAQQSAEDREKWRSELLKKEMRDEGNYRHLANTQRDNTAMLLTEIQNQNARFDTKALKMQEETRSIIHWEMVNAVTDSQKQYSQRDIVKLIGRGEGIPFPREHGYVFRKCTVRIKSEKGLNMFPAPLYIDQKPVGRLFDGDEVWIMQDVPFPAGWSAVRAMNLGVNGWVDKAFIAIENCVNEALLTPA